MKKDSQILYRHIIHDNYSVKNDKETYSISLAGKASNGTVEIGVAVCSKTDTFCKKDGRSYAAERLIHNPTFKFPVMHKNPNRAVLHWFEVLDDMSYNKGRILKNHVSAIQREFEKTPMGIRLKMDRQRKEAEKEEARRAEREEARKKAIAEYKDKLETA